MIVIVRHDHTADEIAVAIEVLGRGVHDDVCPEPERALELARGLKASPYVTYAESIAVPEQDRAAFTAALEKGKKEKTGK